MVHARPNAIWLTLGMALLSTEGHACTVIRIISNVEVVKAADAIVRATAHQASSPKARPDLGAEASDMTLDLWEPELPFKFNLGYQV